MVPLFEGEQIRFVAPNGARKAGHATIHQSSADSVLGRWIKEPLSLWSSVLNLGDNAQDQSKDFERTRKKRLDLSSHSRWFKPHFRQQAE
jgi:hypothetical protein